MERRAILKAVGTSTIAGMTVLAGCSGGGGNGDGDGGGGGNDTQAAGGGEGTTGGGESTTQSAEATPTAGGAGTTPTTGTGGGTATAGTGTGAPTTGVGGTTPAETGAPTTGSGGGLSGAGTSATTSGAGGGGAMSVGMHTEGSNYYFDPIGLFVESGTTVTFENVAGSHSSTAYQEGNGPAQVTRIPQGAEAWNSEILTGSDSFEHTFNTEGTYDYFCIPHKSLGMVGRIVVGSPGGPAEGSMPPDGDVPESQAIVDQGTIAYSDFS